ncbi:MAG: dihydrolipoyl dehydrogenase family protein [Gammaproteobacteria bacterium]
MQKNAQMRDLIVIGGGVGGLVTASIAGQLGLKVTMIERGNRLGGDCLHYGCVPSKTLIHSAKLAHAMRHAARLGLPGFDPQVNIARINARIREVVEQIQKHDDPERFRGYGVDVRMNAGARFTGPQEIETDGVGLQGRRIVIATGSRPAVPAIPGLQESNFVTNEDVYTLDGLPDKLAVLGAGPIGLELAQAFQRLGSQVTIIEAQARVLPNEDTDIVDALGRCLREEGIGLHTGVSAERVSIRDGRTTVHCGGGMKFECERLLVAVGRRPNVEDLNLDRAGIEFTARGINVDHRMRTSNKRVYACGDVTGVMPFTHVAEYQAGVIIGNALFGAPRKADYRAVPWVIFTDPEFARVGKNETQARAEGLNIDTTRFEFHNVDRAKAEGSTDGLVKLTLHKGRIIGASVLGPDAGELVHELAVAVAKKFKASDLSNVVHAYPTLADINRRAANAYLAPKLFSPAVKRLVGWINQWIP